MTLVLKRRQRLERRTDGARNPEQQQNNIWRALHMSGSRSIDTISPSNAEYPIERVSIDTSGNSGEIELSWIVGSRVKPRIMLKTIL
mmetsp:Transcript_2850/g.10889  ORF Transcript_2850/g.10889 Transcript_2850/m.10889 type:complete len:87 (+) Transcript_2850:2440-2700(+)